MDQIAQSHRPLARLLDDGQRTQYNSELDGGYWNSHPELVRLLPKSYTILTTGQYSGNATIQLIHLQSDTGAFTAADKTYTDAGKCGVFKAAGGETVIITGSASNNGTFTTASATANTVVFVEAITNEADAPMTTFKKQEVITNGNNCVFDNNTGLMWARYQSVKMGIAGDGKMPWTGVPYDIFAFCAAANVAALGGYIDWRVSKRGEADSLIDDEAPTGYPNATAFPSFPTGNIWTITTIPVVTANAVDIAFSNGRETEVVKTTALNVILVRG